MSGLSPNTNRSSLRNYPKGTPGPYGELLICVADGTSETLGAKQSCLQERRDEDGATTSHGAPRNNAPESARHPYDPSPYPRRRVSRPEDRDWTCLVARLFGASQLHPRDADGGICR